MAATLVGCGATGQHVRSECREATARAAVDVDGWRELPRSCSGREVTAMKAEMSKRGASPEQIRRTFGAY